VCIGASWGRLAILFPAKPLHCLTVRVDLQRRYRQGGLLVAGALRSPSLRSWALGDRLPPPSSSHFNSPLSYLCPVYAPLRPRSSSPLPHSGVNWRRASFSFVLHLLIRCIFCILTDPRQGAWMLATLSTCRSPSPCSRPCSTYWLARHAPKFDIDTRRSSRRRGSARRSNA
jgi:hypothetical protein